MQNVSCAPESRVTQVNEREQRRFPFEGVWSVHAGRDDGVVYVWYDFLRAVYVGSYCVCMRV